MRAGMHSIEPEPLTHLNTFVEHVGKVHAAAILGVGYPTLIRAIRGAPIRLETYAQMVQRFEAYQDSLPKPPSTPPVVDELTQEELEAIQQLVERRGKTWTAAALFLSAPTLTKILHGYRPRGERLAKLRARLAQPLAQPPEPTISTACPHCDGLIVEEALAVWLRDVRNRRICRGLLAEAQRKHNNY